MVSKAGARQCSHPSDPVSGLEVRETFRKLRNHFQLFGFLTDATLEGFVDRVLRPNVRADKDPRRRPAAPDPVPEGRAGAEAGTGA